jgi:hypothetical protein
MFEHTPTSMREAHPALEVLDSRDVPAVLNPTVPLNTAPAAPQPTAQPSPSLPPNGAVSSTPAQNAGILLALSPSQVATLANTPAPAANTTTDVEDAARIARATVEQGLRDAVGGSPIRLRMQGRPTFDGDGSFEQMNIA